MLQYTTLRVYDCNYLYKNMIYLLTQIDKMQRYTTIVKKIRGFQTRGL